MPDENLIDPLAETIARNVIRTKGEATRAQVKVLTRALRRMADEFGESALRPEALEALRHWEKQLGISVDS